MCAKLALLAPKHSSLPRFRIAFFFYCPDTAGRTCGSKKVFKLFKKSAANAFAFLNFRFGGIDGSNAPFKRRMCHLLTAFGCCIIVVLADAAVLITVRTSTLILLEREFLSL